MAMTETSRLSRYASNHLPEKTPPGRLPGSCWVAALLWIAFVGAALGNGVPTINVTGGTLALPSTTSGTAGGSASFNVTATNLAEPPGTLTVTAPANIQVSSDGTTFGSSATIPFSSATLLATPVYARLAGTGTVGTISGSISVSGGGATAVNQAANGLLTPAGTSTAVQTPGTVTARKVTFFNNIANSQPSHKGTKAIHKKSGK